MLQFELEGSFLGQISLKSCTQGDTKSVVASVGCWGGAAPAGSPALLPGDILLPDTARAVVLGLEEPSATMRTSLSVLLF